jgi:hypothetical protein
MSSHARDITSRTLSIEEYAQLEEPDEYRSELVRGVLVRERIPCRGRRSCIALERKSGS